MLLTALRPGGKEFHKSGAATEKVLSPLVLADFTAGRARVLLFYLILNYN